MSKTNIELKIAISGGTVLTLIILGLAYFPIRYYIVEPNNIISNIDDDIETKCTITNMEECTYCDIGEVCVEFNFNIDSENKNVTLLIQCDVYYYKCDPHYIDEFSQICLVNSSNLFINQTLTCYYNPDGALYLYPRSTNLQRYDIFSGYFVLSIVVIIGAIFGCFTVCAIVALIIKNREKSKYKEMKYIKPKKTNKYENLEDEVET